MTASKTRRHDAIRELIRTRRVASQKHLRELLGDQGFNVAQATLSRDVRELRLLKVPDAEGGHHYTLPPDPAESAPPLRRLLPPLFVGAEATRNLLVVKTLAGGAQAIAEALDGEEWPEVIGTLAGDDTILVILRDEDRVAAVIRRVHDLAESSE